MSDEQPGAIPESRIVRFLAALEKSSTLLRGVTIVIAFVAVAMTFETLWLSHDITEIADHRPVVVVPGAVGGVYAPGITSANVENALRYITGLGTNFTPANAAQRFQDLAIFMSPAALGGYLQESQKTLKTVESQQQSRVFVLDKDHIEKTGQQTYHYTADGTWTLFSGTLVMGTESVHMDVTAHVKQPDTQNPYGVVLDGLEVHADPIVVNDGSGATP